MKTIRILFLFFAVLSIVSCGGGGGGGVVEPGPSPGSPSIPGPEPTPTAPTTNDGDLPIDQQILGFRPPKVYEAAGAIPAFGSVSQGSHTVDGISTDQVNIGYRLVRDTWKPFATINALNATLNSNPYVRPVTLPAGRTVQIDPNADRVEELYTYADWKAAEEDEFQDLIDEHGGEAAAREAFEEEYGSSYPIPDDVPYEVGKRPISYITYPEGLSRPFHHPDYPHPKGRGVNEVAISDIQGMPDSGNYTGLNVSALTDFPAANEHGFDDYLTWGVWNHYTVEGNNVQIFNFGAFADGVETAQASIPSTGTATYTGLTSGTATKGVQSSQGSNSADWYDRIVILTGQVNLQANFSSGTVTGTVNNLRASPPFANPAFRPAVMSFPDNVVINLGAASIEDGHFDGNAHATSGLSGASGKWGGQFFGTPAAGSAPPAAGGTWGVVQGTGNNDWNAIGGFGSWRE